MKYETIELYIRSLPFRVAIWIEDRALGLELASSRILMRLFRIDIYDMHYHAWPARAHWRRRLACSLHKPFNRLTNSLNRLCYSKLLNRSRYWDTRYEELHEIGWYESQEDLIDDIDRRMCSDIEAWENQNL